MEETRSSYVAPFNVDILEIIFDDLEPVDLLPIHFDRRFWERQSRTFIASLYLVSRLWLGPARRALYRAVTDLQELPDLLEKFHSTIKGNAAIRSCVRRLVLYLNDEWEMGSEIIGLLPRCALSLYWEAGCNTPVVLSKLRLGSVTHLRFSLREVWSKSEWAVALGELSQLEFLYLDGDMDDFSAQLATQDQEEFLPSLGLLSFSCGWKSIAIPPTSPNTLHTFISGHTAKIPREPLVQLIQRHSLSLRRIAFYFAYENEIDYDLIEVASYARGLECIHCDSVDSTSLTLLPPSLIEADFCFADEVDVEVIVAFVEASPSLRMLRCEFYYDADEEEWKHLQNLALERGIDFGCSCVHFWEIGSRKCLFPDWVQTY